MPIEVESPEEAGYDTIDCNLAESSMSDRALGELALDFDLSRLVLLYGNHRGHPRLRALLAAEGECDVDQVLLTPGAALLVVLSAAAAGADVTEYKIDPNHTLIGFDIRHFFARVNGRFKDFSGTISFDDKDIRYKVPVGDPIKYVATQFVASGPENEANRDVTEKPGIGNEREIRGRTKAWENTNY